MARPQLVLHMLLHSVPAASSCSRVLVPLLPVLLLMLAAAPARQWRQ
jgi:hypothetical protein